MTKVDKQTANNVRVGTGLPGPGRPKGARNKLTMSAKEAFQHAFNEIGGADALAAWAKRNPDDFFRLYSRQLRADPAVMAGAATVFIVDRMGNLRAQSIPVEPQSIPLLQSAGK